MKLAYTRSNIIRGMLIYATGDTVAAFLQDQFSVMRLLGMMLVGAMFYAFEIPNYFKFIDQKITGPHKLRNKFKRLGLATLYFNPLWVARHLLFIKLFSGLFSDISGQLIKVAALSFLYNLPVSLSANFFIQNKLKLRWRFMGSAIFSALMAVYYALAANWFK